MFIGKAESNFEFARTRGAKDKQPRKRKLLANQRDKVAEKLANSATLGSMQRARKGKYSVGIGGKVKGSLARKIAADKEGVTQRASAFADKVAESEYKTASRQAKQLNQGKSLDKFDSPAAGLFYDRTKGKHISVKLERRKDTK